MNTDAGKLGRIASGNSLVAANDEAERDPWIAADLAYNELKASPQYDDRRIALAGVSAFEDQFMKDHS